MHKHFNMDRLPSVIQNEQLVLTTVQIAEFFDVGEANIRNNFSNARHRFVEGKHFFKLEGDALADFKNRVKSFYSDDYTSSDENGKPIADPKARSLMLWTRRGVARHAKMINNDVAWDIFEALEDAYFNREIAAKEKHVVTPLDFERGKELKRLASHTRDPYTRELLVAKAANLIAGEDFISVASFYECEPIFAPELTGRR